MTYEASEELIDLIWHDVHELISRRCGADMVRRIAADFSDARVVADQRCCHCRGRMGF